MTPAIFYVKDHSGNLVAAKFLTYNGKTIRDPNITTAQDTPIYTASDSLIPNANPEGFLIVPASYSVSSAIQFGGGIQDALQVQTLGTAGELAYGLPVAIATMIAAFLPGGTQDLQRTYNGQQYGAGITRFVPAFIDAASFNLGIISAYAGLPVEWPDLGGGTLNVLSNSLFRKIQQDEMGPLGLTVANGNSIQAGYNLGITLPGAATAEPDPETLTAENGYDYSSANISIINGTQQEVTENLNDGTSQSHIFTYNADGSYGSITKDYSSTNESGTLLYTETTTISPGGQIETDVLGAGDTISYSNATIILETNSNVTIEGTNNTLIFNTASGNHISFAPGTYSPATEYNSAGPIDITLETPENVSLGTLTFNTATNADSFILTDDMVVNLPGITNNVISAPSASEAPLQILSSYLTDLGVALSPSELSADNYAYLNPQAPGALSGTDGILSVSSGNLSNDTISNAQTLNLGSGAYNSLELTSQQFNGFTTIEGGSSTTQLYITTGGTDSIANDPLTVNAFVATGWDGTTLIGNNDAGQLLETSTFGNDTLLAGSGAGDSLVAQEGVDTLVGGSGGATFYAYNGLAAGSVITGNGAGNTLYTIGDISHASVTGVQTLELVPGRDGTITLTPTELAGFSTVEASLIGATGGTYNLTGKTSYGALDATSSEATTVLGDGAFAASGSGNDTLTANNAAYDILSATGNGNDTLTAGTGAHDTLTASGDGNDTLSAANDNYYPLLERAA